MSMLALIFKVAMHLFVHLYLTFFYLLLKNKKSSLEYFEFLAKSLKYSSDGAISWCQKWIHMCFVFLLLLVFSSSLVAGGTDTVLPAVSLKTE